MSNLKMIEMLCGLVEQQASVIHYLVVELEQARCLTESERKMVEETKKDYSSILGTDEVPDFLEEQ